MKKMFWVAVVLLSLSWTIPVQAQEKTELTLFVDKDSLTLLVQDNTQSFVSLIGIGFEVEINENRETFDLSHYESFRSLYFDRIHAPLCLRLVRNDSTPPLPQQCSPNSTLTQRVLDADAFWYDSVRNETRTLTLVQVSNPLEYCLAGQPSCDLTYITPDITPTPPVTVAPRRATSTPTVGNGVTQNQNATLQVAEATSNLYIRSDPSTSRNSSLQVATGGTMWIKDGPVESDGYEWYLMEFSNGTTGYVANSVQAGWLQFLSPGTPVKTSFICEDSRLTSIVHVGEQGYPSPGFGNSTLRADPGGRALMDIPASEIFEVISGPYCTSNSTMWFEVEYNGATGWISQGNNERGYWISPK